MKPWISILCLLLMLNAGCGRIHSADDLERVLEGAIIDAQWNDVTPDYALNTDHLLLYFSAHWCPPCQAFTPKLVEFYNKENGGQLFQVLFISADHSEKEMRNYARETRMPWPAVVYHSEATKKLKKQFSGQGIPRLVMLDRDGNVAADSFKGTKYLGPQHVLNELKKELDKRKIDPAGISESTGEPLSTPEKLDKQFTIEGIGERAGRKMAVINGKIYSKGDDLGEGVRISDITTDYVEIDKEGNHYRLTPDE